MKRRRIIPIILIIAGIALIGFSLYIREEVASGKIKIAGAQSNLEKGKGLFSQNPVTEAIGKGVTQGAEGKISEGQAQINFYEGLASICMIGGIACIVVGVGSFFFGRKKK